MSRRGGNGGTGASATVVIIGAALAASLAVTRGSASSAQVPAGEPRGSTDARATPVTRPFDHRRHERISCRECHGAGEDHRTIRVRTPHDCATCHHDEERALECTLCHASHLPPPRTIATAMPLPGTPRPATRELPFRHELHASARSGLACRDCHGVTVMLTADRECASCHSQHHRPSADCGACHSTPKAGVHAASAHLSCGGSGCHSRLLVPPPSSSRTVCLACHPAQREHEPRSACAECHGVPLAVPPPREVTP